MKFVSGKTITDTTKKYVEVQYNKLGDAEKSILNEYVSNCTDFSDYLGLTEYLFNIADTHYPDLYRCGEEFLHNKFLKEVVVNGKSYMMFACWVWFGDLCPCIRGLYIFEDIPCFAFYEFVDQTNTDDTVGANMKADKMYSCEIDKEDYPEWVNIMKKSDILKLIPKGTRSLYKGDIE